MVCESESEATDKGCITPDYTCIEQAEFEAFHSHSGMSRWRFGVRRTSFAYVSSLSGHVAYGGRYGPATGLRGSSLGLSPPWDVSIEQ